VAIFIDQCKRLEAATEMGSAGGSLLSTLMAWLEFVYFLPAKLALLIPDGNSALGRYFELDCSSGTHWGGALFSGVVWVALLVGVSFAWDGRPARADRSGR
jgi:hypothetical protein